MKRLFRALLARLRAPRTGFLLCFYPLFALLAAGTVLLLVYVPRQTAWHYLLYALSAAATAYFAYTLVYLAPKLKAACLRGMRRHKFTNELVENYGFRTIAFAAAGFVLNAAYAALQAAVGIAARSVWNITVAAFYLLLIALKGIVLFRGRSGRGGAESEIAIYRTCGWLVNLFPVMIAGIVVLANKADMNDPYAGMMIYAAALYTFCKIASSVFQFWKARRQDRLTVQAIRNINLVSALFSVLVLQVSMIQAFGSQEDLAVNGVTGGVVALLVLAVGICMIVKAYRLRRKRAAQDVPPEEREG